VLLPTVNDNNIIRRGNSHDCYMRERKFWKKDKKLVYAHANEYYLTARARASFVQHTHTHTRTYEKSLLIILRWRVLYVLTYIHIYACVCVYRKIMEGSAPVHGERPLSASGDGVDSSFGFPYNDTNTHTQTHTNCHINGGASPSSYTYIIHRGHKNTVSGSLSILAKLLYIYI